MARNRCPTIIGISVRFHRNTQKLGKLREPVFYVDGFAGQGRLDDGTEGSALIAAKLASEPAQKSRRGILHCINVESDPEVFRNLEAATAPYNDCVTNLHGTFQERLPEILTLTGKYTAFFFIDPFGTQGAEISTLEALGNRSGRTEALVRYDDTRVKRLIMWAEHNSGNLEEKHRKVAAGLAARVKQLANDEAADRVRLELLLGSDLELRQQLIEGYESEVKRRAKFPFSINYPLRNPDTGGHRYYLVHFCQFVDGYTHMANFMAKAERTFRKLSSGDGDLFSGGAKQTTFLQIDEHLARAAEAANVNDIVARLPVMVWRNRWQNKRIQLRYVLGEIVRESSWRATRNEWIKALQQFETDGWVELSGREDGNWVQFAGNL